jgi:hypothetical protein
MQVIEDEADAYLYLYSLLNMRKEQSRELYHNLALGVPESALAEVLEHVVHLHDELALLPLLAKAKRVLFPDAPLLSQLNCVKRDCADCRGMRKYLVAVLRNHPDNILKDDYSSVRERVQASLRSNLYIMRRPLLWTNPNTDAVFQDIVLAARQRWKMFHFAVFARILWSRWLMRQMAPGSRFVTKLMQRLEQRMTVLQVGPSRDYSEVWKMY